MTDEQKAGIDALSHLELCRLWRFSSIGDTFWQGEVGNYAKNRLWSHFGGFTPAISKQLGWGNN
jgi:hypothetical protein